MKSSPVSKGGTIYEIVYEIGIRWKELLCIADLFWIKDPNVCVKSHNHSPGQHPCVVFLICSSLFWNIGTVTISLGLSFHACHRYFGRQDDKVTQQIHTHTKDFSIVLPVISTDRSFWESKPSNWESCRNISSGQFRGVNDFINILRNAI